MLKKFTFISIGLLAALLAWTLYKKPTPTPSAPTLPQHVLFLGNSFTGANDLPATFAAIASSLGQNVIYQEYSPGGYRLSDHSQDVTSLQKINSDQWDFVVLQEQSQLPTLSPENVNIWVTPFAQKLVAEIRKNHGTTTPVFFETWGYKNGDADACKNGLPVCTYADMQQRLNNTYNLLAQKNNAALAPIGEAWTQILSQYPEINLYQDDGKHPSPAGTYLAACIFYETILKKDVRGAGSLNLEKKVAKILRETAHKTINEDY